MTAHNSSSYAPRIARKRLSDRGEGFISGVNYQDALDKGANSFVGQEFPATSIVSRVENYCRANPQDHLADAAEALVVELKEK